ncbi:uncharacterized protein V1516DRAFT_661583 [Lipomyces oligophaga]|uniref:uncharacterized protein n=1 Tax=Lipomyces oligophaga TaxID=45792 RepID=UPI0034CE73D4
MISKSVLSVLALAASVYAQTSCNATSLTAFTQADLDKISSCEVFSGNIILSPPTTGVSFSINGVQEIGGSLTCTSNANLTSLSAASLETIDGTFDLTEVTQLGTLNFPRLATVGAINWVTLPSIQSLTFTTGVTNCQDILISDTSLSTLDGISLTQVARLEVNNCLDLDEISMPLQYVTDAVDISYNGATNVTFPSLVWANNLTFQDVSSISTPKLSTVNASYIIISNTMKSFVSKNLTSVGGLSVSKNDALTSLSFPNLETIGTAGLEISNNTKLVDISGFPKLTSVSGAIVLAGDFDNATFPDLDLVRGAVTIESTGDFDCSDFDDMKENREIRGNDYVCSAASTSTSASLTASATESGSSSEVTSDATTTSDSSSETSSTAASATSAAASSSSSAGAAIVGTSTSGVAFGGLIAAIFFGIF